MGETESVCNHRHSIYRFTGRDIASWPSSHQRSLVGPPGPPRALLLHLLSYQQQRAKPLWDTELLAGRAHAEILAASQLYQAPRLAPQILQHGGHWCPQSEQLRRDVHDLGQSIRDV